MEMRSFTWLIAGLFSIYSIQPPIAHASREIQAPRTLPEAAAMTVDFMDELGMQAFDDLDRPLTADDLLKTPRRSLYMTAPLEEGRTLKLQVRMVSVKKGLGYTLVASDLDTGKILSRRRIAVDPKATDAVAEKVRLRQTVKSMEGEIAKSSPVRTGKASLTSQVKFALQGLFGIPSARASGLNLGTFVAISAIVGFIAVFTLIVATSENQIAVEFRPAAVKGALGVASLAIGAILVSMVIAFCSDELIAIIRAFRS